MGLRSKAKICNGPDTLEFGTAQQLPEPSTLGLTLTGLLSLIGLAALHRVL